MGILLSINRPSFEMKELSASINKERLATFRSLDVVSNFLFLSAKLSVYLMFLLSAIITSSKLFINKL